MSVQIYLMALIVIVVVIVAVLGFAYNNPGGEFRRVGVEKGLRKSIEPKPSVRPVSDIMTNGKEDSTLAFSFLGGETGSMTSLMFVGEQRNPLAALAFIGEGNPFLSAIFLGSKSELAGSSDLKSAIGV